MHLALLLHLSFLLAGDQITVHRHAPTTQVTTFDPAHPPADLRLPPGEDALTRMLFNCTVKLKYDETDRAYRDGKWHVVTQLNEVDVSLDLTNTIFLPRGTTDKLRAHELGHAQINGIIYEKAEDAARRAAEQAMNHPWPGDGATPDAADKAATDAAVEAICHDYLHATADRAFRIGEIYDDLTAHGSNQRDVSEAIESAIDLQKIEAKK
jgi:hypothetical protein